MAWGMDIEQTKLVSKTMKTIEQTNARSTIRISQHSKVHTFQQDDQISP